MPRAPFQIGVFPFRLTTHDFRDYLIFQRSDQAYWQCIAGGGEDSESPLEAAKREAYEEACIPATCAYLALTTTASAPISEFKDSRLWGSDLLVIPIHYFGVRIDGCETLLSHEHLESRWLNYQGAQSLLRWDSDKTALWELEQRLKRGEMPKL